MRTEEIRDLCSVYCVEELAAYDRAEFSMYLVGTGITRTLYELTARDRLTHAHLFDIRVEGTAQALDARALRAGTNSDAQAVLAAFKVARRIIDTNTHLHTRRFLLELNGGSTKLRLLED